MSPVPGLLDDASKGEDVVVSQVVRLETGLSRCSESSDLCTSTNLAIKNCCINLGHNMSNHDGLVVPWVLGISCFVDGCDGVQSLVYNFIE